MSRKTKVKKAKKATAKPKTERRATKIEQLLLDRGLHGGTRPGAGRPKSPDSGLPHTTRPDFAKSYPILVTTKVCGGLPSLRGIRAYEVVRNAFQAGCERSGFRVIHFSVQSNHIHLIAEADDRSRLSRGVQGLLVRIARGLNKLWRRTGRLFTDRYHDQILRSPREVRNAIRYVLQNIHKHCTGAVGHEPDPCSSGPWFEGWKERFDLPDALRRLTRPVAIAATYLLRVGWRRHGLIPIDETPSR